jgi:hypothetical protein
MIKPSRWATSVPEFLSIIKELGYPLLYRGQAKDWPLLPSLARPRHFLVAKPLHLESQVLDKLKQLGYPYFHNSIAKESDWILHAQHYGLPTRLLDFTSNPLKALFFATESTQDEADGIVWSIDKSCDVEFPKPECRSLRFYAPAHINDRITAQESSFAVFPIIDDNIEILPIEKYPDLEKISAIIHIPHHLKDELRLELSVLGVNRMTIFPGIEGVIEKIKEECGL